MAKEFFMKDLSGRGETSTLSKEGILQLENDDDDSGWLLHDFAEEGTTGDIWRTYNMEITITKDDEEENPPSPPFAPNGFESWHETHFEIVTAIQEALKKGTTNKVTEKVEEQGTGGLYEMAAQLTHNFEALHKGREWDGEFYDEIDKFVEEELYN